MKKARYTRKEKELTLCAQPSFTASVLKKLFLLCILATYIHKSYWNSVYSRH